MVGEDLASDVDINEYLNQFIRVKTLYELNQIQSILERGYEALELLSLPDELLELEQFYLRYKNKLTKKESKQWNKIV